MAEKEELVIKVNQAGKSVIEQLCDLALRQGGLGNLNQINLVLKSLILIKSKEEKEVNCGRDSLER